VCVHICTCVCVCVCVYIRIVLSDTGCVSVYMCVYVSVFMCVCVCVKMIAAACLVRDTYTYRYGVALGSRIDKIIGLFCKRAL